MTHRTSAILATILAFALAAIARGQGCSNSTESCLQAHATPGCKDATCCNSVCTVSPTCCSVAWDAGCASLADSTCAGLCGASASGPCTTQHATPGCSDATCCSTVCAVDPGCCQFQWDATCLFEAENFCAQGPPVQCGAAGQSSCLFVHGTPGCSDAACCNTVCGLDPSCCTFAWDQFCVQFAQAYCSGCNLQCPAGSVDEAEPCGARNNDPCGGNGQAPVALAASAGACGELDGSNNSSGTWTGDRDFFAVTVADTDGDGKARVTVNLAASAPAFAVLVPASCPVNIASALIKVNSPSCTNATAAACIAPGNYWLMVVPGTYPTPGSATALACGSTLRYTTRVDVSQDGCAPACSMVAGACFEAHPSPGCYDSACCQATCVNDPYCCSTTWDVACARAAAVICNAPIPPNDTCATAQPLAVGQTIQFSTIRAQSEGPNLPATCDAGSGATMGPDLWYSYDTERGGSVAVSTCGSATDLRLAVYSGTCSNATLVACNSSSILCSPNTGARIQFQAVCGTRYLIRVGGEIPSNAGPGQITLSAQGPICPDHCPSDINRDHAVDGADLGLLLGNWGRYGLGDLNVDGVVDGADLGILLGDWGACH